MILEQQMGVIRMQSVYRLATLQNPGQKRHGSLALLPNVAVYEVFGEYLDSMIRRNCVRISER